MLDTSFLGSVRRMRVAWRGRELLAETQHDSGLQPGDAVELRLAPEHCAWVAA